MRYDGGFESDVLRFSEYNGFNDSRTINTASKHVGSSEPIPYIPQPIQPLRSFQETVRGEPEFVEPAIGDVILEFSPKLSPEHWDFSLPETSVPEGPRALSCCFRDGDPTDFRSVITPPRGFHNDPRDDQHRDERIEGHHGR